MITLFFSSKENKWKRLSGMTLHSCKSPCAATVSGNALYLGDSATNECFEYSISDNKWSRLPLMRFKKDPLRLCVLGDFLYALGGTHPERYSFIKQQWQCIAQPLESQPHQGAAFATFNGYIFAIGGDSCHRGSCFEPSWNVYRFDPVTNKWKTSASTNEPHINAAVFVDNGFLYVAGGEKSQGRTKLQPSNVVEMYDHELKKWVNVPQRHIPPNKLGAIETLHGKVFFVQGVTAVESGIRIPPDEVYHISLSSWSNVHLPMLCGTFAILPLNSKLGHFVEPKVEDKSDDTYSSSGSVSDLEFE